MAGFCRSGRGAPSGRSSHVQLACIQRQRPPGRFEYEIRGAILRGQRARQGAQLAHTQALPAPPAAANLVGAKTIASGPKRSGCYRS
jgi:hypothetical protein